MKTIVIKTQKQFDKLPKSFKGETEIRIEGDFKKIDRTPVNSYIVVVGNATIQYVWDNATIQDVRDNATIRYVRGNATIQNVWDNATIQNVWDNATIQNVWDNATIQDVRGNATIRYVRGNATIQYVWDNATIQDVRDNATIRYVRGNATIQYVWDNAMIQNVWGNATIQDGSGNCVIKIFSSSVKLIETAQQATIIFQDCKNQPTKKEKSVNIINTTTPDYTLKEFIKRYRVEETKTALILYKVVQNDYTDFYTGKVKYDVGKTITAPDWNTDNNHECGGGLHLSSSVELCAKFNHPGKKLKCRVLKKDILVCPRPQYPEKVRCRKVKVLEEIE